jgi:hypothetical protein
VPCGSILAVQDIQGVFSSVSGTCNEPSARAVIGAKVDDT